MFGIAFFTGAALLSMWGTRTAAGLLIGGEVVKRQLLKRELKRAFELDLNPMHGGTQGFGVVTLTPEELPESLHDYCGSYILSKTEATMFLAALQDLMDGHGELSANYDFAWMKGVQEKRKADSQFAKLLH